VIIKSVFAKNLYSYDNLSLDESFFKRDGVTLIFGKNFDKHPTSNGSGKTSILKIIYYLIYGEDLNGVRLQEIAKKGSTNGCYGEVVFEDMGSTFKIIRYRGYKNEEGESLVLDSNGNPATRKETKILFYMDSMNLTGESDTDTQSIIESKIGISSKLFLNSILIKDDQKDNILYENDAEMKKRFSEVLEIDNYDKSLERVKKAIKKKQEDALINKEKIKNLELGIEKSKANILVYEKKHEEFHLSKKSLIEELQKKKDKALDEAKLIKDDFKEPQDKKPLLDKIEELQRKIESLRLSKSDLTSSVKVEVERLNGELSSTKVKKDSIKKAILKMEEIISKKESSKTCPTCKRDMDKEHVDHLKEEINSDKLELNSLKEELKQLNDLEKQTLLTIADKNKDLSKAKEKEISLESETKEGLIALEKEIESVRIKIKEIEDQERKNENYFNLRSKLAEEVHSLGRMIRREESKENPYKEMIEKEHEEISSQEGLLSDIKEHLETQESELKYLEFWRVGFGPNGIQSYLIDELLVQLNQKANEYLDELFDGGASIEFSGETEKSGQTSNKISVKITMDGQETMFDSLSSGEKRRYLLATSLAMSDLSELRSGRSLNLMFLDEPMSNIDSYGQEKCLRLFAKLASRKDAFFVISHDPSFQSLCSSMITVEKKNGTSSIVD